MLRLSKERFACNKGTLHVCPFSYLDFIRYSFTALMANQFSNDDPPFQNSEQIQGLEWIDRG
jgi:hypothetical protein